jgi:hypothetical protein
MTRHRTGIKAYIKRLQLPQTAITGVERYLDTTLAFTERRETDIPVAKDETDAPRQHLRDFLDYAEEARRLNSMAENGICMLPHVPNAIKVLADLEPDGKGPKRQEALDRSKKIAEFAQREIDADFPLLRSHTIVAIWAALEAAFSKFSVAWLVAHPEILARPEFQKIRIPVGVYETVPLEERMAFIMTELGQSYRGQPAIARYEGLLSALGLGGGLKDDQRRVLYEISQVRNLILHQRSIADQRFCEGCPWLGLKPGDLFVINRERYRNYLNHIHDYVFDVAIRIRKFLGEPIEKLLNDAGGPAAAESES